MRLSLILCVFFWGYIIQKRHVKLDPEEINAIVEWPTPSTRKQLQHVLGFANIYRHFIRDFSCVSAPLTKLTSTSIPYQWSEEAEAAFHWLKGLSTSAPVLIHSDPSQPFFVEVDASDTGVGAVLFRCSGPDKKHHPCAFYSKKLSLAERNYNVGDRELLAVKLALEERRYWLEGAKHPFVVWTDHKNLAYIQTAKWLNSRPARWALFFSRFQFTLLYHPGSWNIKPAALSHQHCQEEAPSSPNTILPASHVVATLTWEVESVVHEASISNRILVVDLPSCCS